MCCFSNTDTSTQLRSGRPYLAMLFEEMEWCHIWLHPCKTKTRGWIFQIEVKPRYQIFTYRPFLLLTHSLKERYVNFYYRLAVEEWGKFYCGVYSEMKYSSAFSMCILLDKCLMLNWWSVPWSICIVFRQAPYIGCAIGICLSSLLLVLDYLSFKQETRIYQDV